MAVFLKDVKRELQSDIGKVGKNPDGSYKFIPPSIVGRKLKDYTQLRVSKITSGVTLSNNTIFFSGLVSSETRGIRYKVTIQFQDMKFKDIPSKTFDQKVVSGSGKNKITKYHKIPSIQNNPVAVRCQCKDFQHRFSWPLSKLKGLIGAPISYTRKTDPWNKKGTGGHPSVNSTKKLGICKHINSVLNVLNSEGMIKERVE